MKLFLSTLLFFAIPFSTISQTITPFADSIRKTYKIPEIAFAVVSSDTVFEMQTLGFQRINSFFQAKPNDRFHIGSNTKAITSFIAALLVQQGKIKWDTKFFELYPNMKHKSKKVYYNLTLQDLLTFRAALPGYTYTFAKPTKEQFKGNYSQQRLQLANYFLRQKPIVKQNGLTFSNVGYILAGLMIEKASGKSFQELVTDFGKTLKIDFGFDNPNLSDTLQPWGHNTDLSPVPPADNYKMNWLLAAGNINVSLSGYIKFIQLQLKGLKGQSALLSQAAFNYLHFGLPVFSFGWFSSTDTVTNHHISSNEGNAGAFITQVQVIKEIGKAYIVLTNSATQETSEGIAVLLEYLKSKYGR